MTVQGTLSAGVRDLEGVLLNCSVGWRHHAPQRLGMQGEQYDGGPRWLLEGQASGHGD